MKKHLGSSNLVCVDLELIRLNSDKFLLFIMNWNVLVRSSAELDWTGLQDVNQNLNIMF